MVEYDAATKAKLDALNKKKSKKAKTDKPASKPAAPAKAPVGGGAQRSRRPALPEALVALIDNYVETHTTEFARINRGALTAKVQAAYQAHLDAATDTFVASNAAGVLS